MIDGSGSSLGMLDEGSEGDLPLFITCTAYSRQLIAEAVKGQPRCQRERTHLLRISARWGLVATLFLALLPMHCTGRGPVFAICATIACKYLLGYGRYVCNWCRLARRSPRYEIFCFYENYIQAHTAGARFSYRSITDLAQTSQTVSFYIKDALLVFDRSSIFGDKDAASSYHHLTTTSSFFTFLEHRIDSR